MVWTSGRSLPIPNVVECPSSPLFIFGKRNQNRSTLITVLRTLRDGLKIKINGGKIFFEKSVFWPSKCKPVCWKWKYLRLFGDYSVTYALNCDKAPPPKEAFILLQKCIRRSFPPPSLSHEANKKAQSQLLLFFMFWLKICYFPNRQRYSPSFRVANFNNVILL